MLCYSIALTTALLIFREFVEGDDVTFGFWSRDVYHLVHDSFVCLPGYLLVV